MIHFLHIRHYSSKYNSKQSITAMIHFWMYCKYSPHCTEHFKTYCKYFSLLIFENCNAAIRSTHNISPIPSVALCFQLPYWRVFGGVSALRTDHFKMINGFSNKFFGWGGEELCVCVCVYTCNMLHIKDTTYR